MSRVLPSSDGPPSQGTHEKHSDDSDKEVESHQRHSQRSDLDVCASQGAPVSDTRAVSDRPHRGT
jgi:hypothetical protein